ncbi:MAG: L,D-transpeptidase family protein [Rhodomicrobium sp.]
MAAPGNPTSDLGVMRNFTCFQYGSRNVPLFSGRAFAAALLALASFIATFEPAAARTVRQHRQHRRVERESSVKVEVNKPVGPMFAVVSLADQHVSFYDANGLWERSGVSTGVPEHPTPAGVFTILEKERWHHSNIYSGAPMPFMQRLAWTGVAMHEGAVHEGHTASHGCIRLHADFARRLFAVTNAGQRVIVAQEDVTPAGIAHAHLPKPKMLMAPLEAATEKPAAGGSKGIEPVALDTQALPSPAAKLVNPAEFAQTMKAAAAAKAAGALKAKKAAIALAESKAAEARRAARDLDAAEEAFRRARDEVADATRAAAKGQGEEAIQKAAERKTAAEGKLASAEAKLRDARDAETAKDQDAALAQSAVRDAEAAAEDAADAATRAAKQAARRLEPLSIFISRKTGRLYVRQATEHLFDIPISIRDPQRPIGTHLFIATRPGEDGASLRWVSLTPPAAVEVKVGRRMGRRERRIWVEDEAEPALAYPETAAGALDRIEIPEEAAQRISELLWTGATLIISDVEMSGEGRFAMDFMILSRTRVREP